MDDQPKKKRKNKEDNGGQKEHKKNWREYMATAADIRQMLADNVLLRQNVITGRPEFRVPMQDEFDPIGRKFYPTGASPLDEWRSATEWQPVSDRFVNTVWSVFSDIKDVRLRDIWTVINSDFVPLFNPFRHYLDRLPPSDNSRGAIFELSMTVTVKGGTEKQSWFYFCLRKWLVGMVAGWIDEAEVNNLILVLVGRQGIYKTTWFNALLPPQLKAYFHSNTSFGNMTKEEVMKLSKYGLICCEELDTMKPAEMNRLKWAVTLPVTDEREPYAHYPTRRKHIASYCGTGNNIQFIDDATGTRRWLPFEVESIQNPREHPIDHDAVFAEAYALYREGFEYWFSEEDGEALKAHNSPYETPRDERELVEYYFDKPSESNAGEFMPTAVARQIVSTPGAYISTVALGRAFSKLEFKSDVIGHVRGYYVVRLTDEERRSRMRMRAIEARQAATRENAQVTDDTDIF